MITFRCTLKVMGKIAVKKTKERQTEGRKERKDVNMTDKIKY